MTAVMTADAATLIAALRQVDGVADAELDPDDEGGLGLLRLDLHPGVDEATVASSAGRLLHDRFGLGIDTDAVSVLEEVHELTATAESMTVVKAGDVVTVTVTLTQGGASESGEAVGDNTHAGVLTAVATATVAAAQFLLQALTSDASTAELTAVDGPDEGSAGSVTVAVRVTPQGAALPELLEGVSAVHQDPRQAVVRAVLVALASRFSHREAGQ